MTVHDPIDRLEREAKRAEALASVSMPSFALDDAYVIAQLAEAEAVGDKDRWAIKGWHPWNGLVPHFGPAKVGKSTGISTMVVATASIDTSSAERITHWMTKEIHRHGRVLWYSGEETREQVMRRLRKLVRKAGYTGDDVNAVLSRIIVVTPISMSEQQWPARNPALMSFLQLPAGDRDWVASAAHDWLWTQVEAWNARVAAAGGTDDERIVMVVIDSVTSASGFSSTEEAGIQNFLFLLNRRSIRADVSVIVVAHTPKEVKIDPLDPDADALGRLKGNGAWSALSRLIVEWRRPLGQGYEGRNIATRKPLPWYESMEAVDRGLVKSERGVKHLLVAKVADGNLDFDRDKLWMVKDGDGCLDDKTERMIGAAASFADWKADGNVPPEPIDTRREAKACIFAVTKDLLLAKHAEYDRECIEVSKRKGVTQNEIHKALQTAEAKAKFKVLDLSPSKGGIDFNNSRPNSLSKDLHALTQPGGRLVKVPGGYDLPIGFVDGEYDKEDEIL